jgi:fructose-1,6-bisphosphatase II
MATNIESVAMALRKPVSEVTVGLLKRSRHDEMVNDILAAGARVALIDDGDVMLCLKTMLAKRIGAEIVTDPRTSSIDMVVGAGGSPEGVLSCTARKALGGFFEGRFDFADDPEGAKKRERAIAKLDKFNPELDVDEVMMMDEIVPADDIMFVAAGVTDGFFEGVYEVRGGSSATQIFACGLDNGEPWQEIAWK